MKKNWMKVAAACGLCLSVLACGMNVSAAYDAGEPGRPGGSEWSGTVREQGRMVISEPGRYTLTGVMRGTVYVDPGEGDVRLILDNVRLDGSKGPAITAVSGSSLTIELPEGSVNSILGGPGSDLDSAIYSEIPLYFDGDGQLDMMSMGQDAIRVENGELSFNGGDIRVESEGSGFNAATVNFNGGAVAVDAAQSAFAPGARQNMNGGSFNPEWTPTGDFMQQAPVFGGQSGQQPTQQAPTFGGQSGQQPTQQAPAFGGQSGASLSSTDTAGTVAEGTTENSAMSLTADYDNATTIAVTEDNSSVKISESGTYVVTGSASDGSVTVKKDTTGVVLVLNDLDLTSTSGAALSVNKNAEVQVVISGTVNLTDNENPDDENSADADVADAYDGAAIKVKAGSTVYITGSGTLNVNGNAKNGIKAGDDSSLIIGGDGLTVNVKAVNDGINGNYDVTILDGTVNVSAGDDGIHADHILSIGKDGKGPNLTVSSSTEGLEGTVVNIAGGRLDVTASDDAVNAANGDGLYEGVLDYSVNITGGDVTLRAGTDGIDSNGNVNLIGGSADIRSANDGGDAGIDYDGELYISDGFGLNNRSGVAGPDGMPGMMGGMSSGAPGGMGGMSSGAPGGMGGMSSGAPGGMGGMSGGAPGGMGGMSGGAPGNMGGMGGR